MPSLTLDVSSVYPEGTSLGAYEVRTQSSQDSAPLGTPVDTDTVSAGEVTFDNLTEDETYLAVGQVSGAWVKYGFTVNLSPPGVLVNGVELATQEALDSEISTRASADTSLDGRLDTAESDVTALEADVAVIGECVNLNVNAGVDQASALQTALDNIESQGGGRVLLPRTGYSGSGITLASRVDVGHAVSLLGQGKRETKFTLTHADATLYFVGSGDPGYTGSTNRGGESGGFHIQGNNTATTVLTMRSTNRMMKDMRLSTPANNGKALYIDQAQNVNWINLEAEDGSHSSSRTVQGIVFDGGASGHNFLGTSLNEFTNGHVVFDASYDAPASLGIDYSNNITFVGNMIERTDTFNPIIHLKAGTNITFIGGAINSGGSQNDDVTAEYDIIKMDNTAARSFTNIGSGGSPSRNLSFYGVTISGTLGLSSAKYANAFRLAADLTNWHQHITVDPSCGYSNCKYLGRLDAGSCVLLAPHPENSSGGGLSAGWSNPAGVGKVNTRIQASAGTVTVKPLISYYELTGNTNLNTLAATYSGHQIVLKFSGTPTVSSSAGNIKLSGLVDMAATADDILCLICDGTDWHETSRVVK